ncbi:MAG: hypothetical protein QXD03_05940, partial [Candidatus Anstonellales archaeon]
MNLITKEVKPCYVTIFRPFQYSMMRTLFDSVLPNYLRAIFNDLEDYNYELNDDIPSYIRREMTFASMHHFYLKKSSDELKFKVMIPKLIDGSFFVISGNYYIPAIYIVNSPITVRENSISLYSLFCPLTIYFKDRRAIIFGNNVYIEDFLTALYGDDIPDSFFNIYNFEKKTDYESSVSRLSKIIQSDDIENRLNDLIFDDYTRKIYNKFYGISDIKSALNIAISKYRSNEEFIDMNTKRLVFIEVILHPLIRSLSSIIGKYISDKGRMIKIRDDIIIKNFNVMIKNYHYDSVNG